ncbi:DUF993 family protein, partial [Nocardia salmonicida]|uniref:DUF993 family protein n=1 Tax=Nocardia salmonicida TaxID=53431 RepID=UPI003664FA8A
EHSGQAMTVAAACAAPGTLLGLWQLDLGCADELVERGAEVTEDEVRRLRAAVRPESTAVICYTSGTTGTAKGCVISHGNLAAECDTLIAGWGHLLAPRDAYREQIDVVNEAGAQVILMASRALVQVARSRADYLYVYEKLLAGVDRPVILHWLGTMFDPALHGYWGSADIDTATETFRTLIENNRSKIDGVKVSLLDAAHEVALRRALPAGVRLYTGDDFNYPELIIGDAQGHSDALLGIFAAIYPAASTALQELDNGNAARASQILDATQELGRHIFAAPTYYYKTGIAFLSWLNGKQAGFSMVAGLSTGRSVPHLAELLRLADKAGLLSDPELAAHRMRIYLELNGLGS